MNLPRLIRPSLDKQPWGWTLVTKIGSSPLLLPRPPATVIPKDSCGSFFTVMCFSLQVTHWERSYNTKGETDPNTDRLSLSLRDQQFSNFIMDLVTDPARRFQEYLRFWSEPMETWRLPRCFGNRAP